MSYTTEHDTIDLLRDYMNGTVEPEAWEELRAFALDILNAYADRENLGPCGVCDGAGEIAPGYDGAPYETCPRCDGEGITRHPTADPGLPHILAEDIAP